MLRNGFFAASAAVALWSMGRALEVSVAFRIERWTVELGVSYPQSLDWRDWKTVLGSLTWADDGRYGLTLLGVGVYVDNDDTPADE